MYWRGSLTAAAEVYSYVRCQPIEPYASEAADPDEWGRGGRWGVPLAAAVAILIVACVTAALIIGQIDQRAEAAPAPGAASSVTALSSA